MPLLTFFGLSRAPLSPGYRRNERAGSMPVCQECGALVAVESQALHTSWHSSGTR